MKTLVPDEFSVPLVVEFPSFVFRPLDSAATELDYAAVMASRDDLHDIFGPNDVWPAADLTLEQNGKDLAWHWSLFEQRLSFAWTVLNTEGTKCIGCVYLYWPLLPDYDATVYLWVHSDELAGGLDQTLESTVRAWLAESWPFRNPAFPGRDIPWDEWQGGTVEVPEGVS